ncbi:MAG: ATP-binding cassette domain-containing protein [Alphaproteobacteria bacterium]|nr:ATP-binding cassette domain-containing protein [Alphaproteobacteria bacterium]
MAQEQENTATEEKDDEEEKIVLTKEEKEAAKKMIKSVISPKEKMVMYGLAGVAAVADTFRKVVPQFASKSYNWLGGKLGADYVGSSATDLFGNVACYIYDRISFKMQNKILKDYDTRPEMEQKLLNPEHIGNYARRMGESAGNYMVQNAKKWLGYAGVVVGAGLTVASLSVAALPISAAAASAAVLGGSGVVGIGQYFIQKRLKEKKVQNKDDITQARNDVFAHARQMLVNSQMRAKTLADDQAYASLRQKQLEALRPERSFLKTLSKYFVSLKGVEVVSGAIAAGAALTAGMAIVPAVALTAGVTTTISSLNSAFSARLGLDEYKETFATMFRRYKKGIKDFVYGNEKIKSNANVLQVDKIAYRFRSKDRKSPTFGEYSDKTAFTTTEDIRFGPGITLLSGASGSGKSTLISLLNQGDYVTEGAIRIGTVNENGNFVGQDYRDLQHLEINKNIAFAESQPQLDLLTIDEYIRLGNPQADNKKVEEIKTMLGIVSEEPEIGKDGKPTGKMKPRTLDTISTDSAGEKTRLSIAQALIKDSPIMIFDEPTSGVDPIISKRIVEHLKKLGEEGKTVVFTTHNPEDIEILKPYQAIDIGLHVKGQKGNDIKKFDLSTPRNLENFVKFFKQRTLAEKRVKEEKMKQKVSTHLDYARNLVKKRMNEGTNEVSMGISAEDLITYKKIKGKSLQDATKETADLFGKIGRGNGITIR